MSLQMVNDHSETEILARVLQPEDRELTVEEARYILSLEFRQADVDRMNELAGKARQGVLSAEDERMLESYRQVGYLLAQMKAKARLALKTHSS